MGLMDKMKAQATQLAQKTQETARDSKVKFDQAQAKRRADAMLRNLGALIYAERTGRTASDSPAQVDKLIADISAHEAENGISLTPETGDQHAASQADGPQHQSGSTGFPPPASTDAGASTGFPPPASTDAGASTGFPPEASTTQV